MEQSLGLCNPAVCLFRSKFTCVSAVARYSVVWGSFLVISLTPAPPESSSCTEIRTHQGLNLKSDSSSPPSVCVRVCLCVCVCITSVWRKPYLLFAQVTYSCLSILGLSCLKTNRCPLKGGKKREKLDMQLPRLLSLCPKRSWWYSGILSACSYDS